MDTFGKVRVFLRRFDPLRQMRMEIGKTCVFLGKFDPLRQFPELAGGGWNMHLVLDFRAFLALRQFVCLAECPNR